jgi:hypothetical protein
MKIITTKKIAAIIIVLARTISNAKTKMKVSLRQEKQKAVNSLRYKKSINLLIAVLWFCMINSALAQQGSDTIPEKKEFTISLEFRPRTEYRNGYRLLRTDTSAPAIFTEGRSRIYLNYKTDYLIFHTSFQDIRVWGEQDPRSTNGTLQLFESYIEPSLTKNISVRIGRQKIMYDNQRLFAQNDWRQTGRAHDGIRFIYKNSTLESDLIGAFNQEQGAQERFFEIDYSPVFNNYKILAAHFLKYKPNEKLVFTAINALDGFQDTKNIRTTHYRFTGGGRIESTLKNLYLTLAGYYQYGHTPDGKKLIAFYVQPEVNYRLPKYLTFKLGAEVFSGDDSTNPSTTSHSFDALYGVNHRFLGSMDYFTRFPNDFSNAGLIAPYLFTFFEVNKKLIFRTDEHLFYSESNFIVNEKKIDNYLGFENDLLLIYKPNPYTEIQLGYSYALLTKSMEYIKKGGNSKLWQDWAYLMIAFKPELFRWKK